MVLPIAKNITGKTIADNIVISDFISIAVRIDDDVLKAEGLTSPKLMEDFLQPGRPKVVSEAPHIVTLDGLLPRGFCAHWIKRTAPKLSAARIHDAEKGGSRPDDFHCWNQ